MTYQTKPISLRAMYFGPTRLTPRAIAFAAKRLVFLAVLAALACSAHAAPDDDLSSFIQERGLATTAQPQPIVNKVLDKTSDLVVTAMGFLGLPYKRGGNSAETGFDCSGFVRALYEQVAGLLLPRRADQQAAATQVVEKKELQPGDLVFFNTLRRAFSHVGIYVGDNKFIHAPRPGAQIRMEDMTVPYWTRRFDGARRVLPINESLSPHSGTSLIVGPSTNPATNNSTNSTNTITNVTE